jgi:hypothetical protein
MVEIHLRSAISPFTLIKRKDKTVSDKQERQMAHINKFENALDELFKKRTSWLRSAIGRKKTGPPPKITRRFVKNGISNLQEIASNALANKLAKSEFNKHALGKRAWHIKGFVIDEKKSLFEEWFRKEFPNLINCIYVFWGNEKFIYVGRTTVYGGSRPSSHFIKFWFKDVKRIDIFPSETASQTPKLECLAIHHFDPVRNKKKSATKKWTKKCPLCAIHKNIEEELRKTFKLK